MINKIDKIYSLFRIVAFFLLIAVTGETTAQNRTPKGPSVTKKLKEYRKQVKLDSNKIMVELKSIIPGIVYDLRYASTNNFMKRLMYPGYTSVTFLRTKTAIALQKVQEELNKKGLGLKIFDAYRPYAVTVKFWELVKDERYVANPAKGSGHNRGTTVDLTIIKLSNGDELNMGTGFDNFSDTAHHNFTQLKEEILQNRLLLKNTIMNGGIIPGRILSNMKFWILILRN